MTMLYLVLLVVLMVWIIAPFYALRVMALRQERKMSLLLQNLTVYDQGGQELKRAREELYREARLRSGKGSSTGPWSDEKDPNWPAHWGPPGEP